MKGVKMLGNAKKIDTIVSIISHRYYGGHFLNYSEDMAQETLLSLLEEGKNPFEVDFFTLWKAVSKAFYKTISLFGFSKRLNKTEDEICFPFYSILSMTETEFQELEKIHSLYTQGGYKSVVEYYNLNLNPQQTQKLKKFLCLCFKKK